MFWLNQAKTWKRKAAEVLITFQLEQKLTKEEIFEFYANQIDLGRRGSFAIRGFGEGAQAYFGKDLRDVTLPEAAMLAGLIQRPSFTNPIRWPDRARARRNVVLGLMRENGYITEQQYKEASAAPLTVARGGAESTDAPYFVDLVNDELQDEFQEHDFQARFYRVYTTLDMDLQRDAAEAVRIGMKEVDEQVRRQRRFRRHEAARGAGGAGGAGRADGRGEGAGGRAQLRGQPVEPRAGQAAAGFVLQAVRLRGGARNGTGGKPQADHVAHHVAWTSRRRSGSTRSRTRRRISRTSTTAP